MHGAFKNECRPNEFNNNDSDMHLSETPIACMWAYVHW
jgi:hypothetical protein